MQQERKDIVERTDIEFLVDRFYEKVQADALLGPVFAHVDWNKHLPTMYQFWSSIILGEQSYKGNPFQRHMHLPIDARHFNRWLSVFISTVNEIYSGEKAEEIKQRASSIADLFQHRLNLHN
jgi:hemoglobin